VSGNGAIARISDTTFRGITSGYGIYLDNGAVANASGCRFLDAYGGMHAVGAAGSTFTRGSLSDSTISGAVEAVFVETSNASATASVMVTRSTIESSTYALDAETNSGLGTAYITVSGSMITYNGSGYYQTGTGSFVRSLGNNHISDNAANVGVLSPIGLQ